MEKHLTLPLRDEDILDLKTGDFVYLTGNMFVARDAAHKRIFELLNNGKNLPIELLGACIYYMGPSPARPGRVIGSAGPTTATRMDKYAPAFLDAGQKVMIGKGRRSSEVMDAIVRNHAVYMAAVGGAGALLSKCIKESKIVCYEDLGAEAVREIRVEDFPVIVAADCSGNNIYDLNEYEDIIHENLQTRSH